MNSLHARPALLRLVSGSVFGAFPIPMRLSLLSRLLNQPGARYLCVVVAVYLMIFFTLLFVTDGRPYAIDNNESFSNLWHARSLYENGVAKTKGLADEVFAWHPAASPHVHTHQGNFPRLFSFILYTLGARSIESQIWITTLTIGLAVILLAFQFLRTIGPPLYATLTCLVMMTNYALFTQWHVNTYRVWYGFFFFSSLLCAHHLASKHSRWWIGVSLFNFAALFYGEYVFGAFVGILVCLYAFFRRWNQPSAFLPVWRSVFLGGLIAAAVLLCQLTAYMGWENVKRDIHYTLSARNMAADAGFADEATSFYAKTRVVFWQNYYDTASLKTITAFRDSLFKKHFQHYSPWLWSGVLLLLTGWFAGKFPGGLLSAAGLPSLLPRSVAPPAVRMSSVIGLLKIAALAAGIFLLLDTTLHRLGVLRPTGLHGLRLTARQVFIAWDAQGLPRYDVYLSDQSGNLNYLGQTARGYYIVGDLSAEDTYQFQVRGIGEGWTSPWSKVTVPPMSATDPKGLPVEPRIIEGKIDSRSRVQKSHAWDSLVDRGLLALASVGLALALGLWWTGQWSGIRRLGWWRFSAVLLTLLAGTGLMRRESELFDVGLRNLWIGVLGAEPGGLLVSVGIIGAVLLGATMAALGNIHVLGRRESDRLHGLATWGLCVLAAYAVAYRLFTGYVYSGYLNRQAPFLVFWTDALAGAALFFVVVATLRTAPRGVDALRATVCATRLFLLRRSQRHSLAHERDLGLSVLSSLPFLIGCLLIGLSVLTWFGLQANHWRVLPATRYDFLQSLKSGPLRNASFAVNTYPAPVAAMTHNWAYADSALFSGQVKLTKNGYTIERDHKYLWFADAGANPDYFRPSHALAIVQPASISEALQRCLERRPGSASPLPAAEANGLVQRALAGTQPFLHHELLSSDGHHFSIVRLDWDFPPYLQPMDEGIRTAAGWSFGRKLAASELGQELRRRWRMEIEPLPNISPADRPPSPIYLAEAMVDAQAIFTTNDFLHAGWQRIPLPRLGEERSSAQTTSTVGYAWSPIPGKATSLRRVVVGDNVNLRWLAVPRGDRARVAVNDVVQVVAATPEAGDPGTGSPAAKPRRDGDRIPERLESKVISLSASHPHGQFTSIPTFIPGVYVHTNLRLTADGPEATIRYRYAHQEGGREEVTTVRVYKENPAGQWILADVITFLGPAGVPVRLDEFQRLNPDMVTEHTRVTAQGDTRTFVQWLSDHLNATPADLNRPGILTNPAWATFANFLPNGTAGTITRRIPLSAVGEGRLQLSVTPGTRTKAGPEYHGLPFKVSHTTDASGLDPIALTIELPQSNRTQELPYGVVKLKLRFPQDRLARAEPLVATGVNEAGDFVYALYHDAKHIRLGFDHWFMGGPLTPPIPIDYAAEHEIEISMGSLFPPAEDFLFAGVASETIANMKGNLWVKLDGRTVIETPAEFYESSPRDVTIGKNAIKGTSSEPEFSGEILQVARLWPDRP